MCQALTLLTLHIEDIIITCKTLQAIVPSIFHFKSTRCVLHALLTLPNNDNTLQSVGHFKLCSDRYTTLTGLQVRPNPTQCVSHARLTCSEVFATTDP